MEVLILLALGAWLFFALRSCLRHPTCGGDCAHCKGCNK